MGKMSKLKTFWNYAKYVLPVALILAVGWYVLFTSTGSQNTEMLTWCLIMLGIAVVVAVCGLIINFREVVAWTKEFIRKLIVSLKRNPGIIPLLMLAISFLFYSLNLTDVSDTTAKIQGKGMGLSEFCIMLFSLLVMLCTLNAFPVRKKPNWLMVGLVFIMIALIVYCDSHYVSIIIAASRRPDNPIAVVKGEYIYNAYTMLKTHRVMMIVSAALVALLPVYSKLLKKINTSVEIEDNSSMGAIEIND